MAKICEFKKCEKKAYYATYYGKPERCVTHKGDRKLQYAICVCGRARPCFNKEGEKAMYCSKCKKEGMVDVKNKKCVCGKAQPNFGFPDDKKATHCFKCKKEGMIDIMHKKCKCGIQPTYNYPSEAIGICCSKCKKLGMVDVIHKKCQCGIQPTYNYPNETIPVCCSKCKKEGMINVVNKRCPCGIIPSFNYPNETIGICCSKCKKLGMVDVIHKKCQCGIQPSFNYPNETIGICCSKCKKPGMENIIDKKCKANEAPYNIICPIRGNPKYRGYCTHCFSHLFPDDPLTAEIRKKTKEIAVRNFINSKFEGFIHNETLFTGGCDCPHRREIDHRKLIGNTMLVIETDEFQHRSYDKHDEEIRHDDLYMLYSGKWIFIRYNPDPYKDKKGKKRDPEIKTRFKRLEKEINKQIKRIEDEKNNELVEIIKLYYNANKEGI